MRYDAAHKSATRSKVLAAAARGFRRNGLDKLSIPGLMSDAGLTHGGFYNHFESKKQLLVEALDFAFDEAQAELRSASAAAPAGAKLQAVVACYLSQRHCDSAQTGCPLAGIGSELTREPEPVKQAALRGLDQLKAIVADAIAADGLDLNAESVVATLVGAMLIARLHGDPAQAMAWLHKAMPTFPRA